MDPTRARVVLRYQQQTRSTLAYNISNYELVKANINFSRFGCVVKLEYHHRKRTLVYPGSAMTCLYKDGAQNMSVPQTVAVFHERLQAIVSDQETFAAERWVHLDVCLRTRTVQVIFRPRGDRNAWGDYPVAFEFKPVSREHLSRNPVSRKPVCRT